jgi:hypothetical protein
MSKSTAIPGVVGFFPVFFALAEKIVPKSVAIENLVSPNDWTDAYIAAPMGTAESDALAGMAPIIEMLDEGDDKNAAASMSIFMARLMASWNPEVAGMAREFLNSFVLRLAGAASGDQYSHPATQSAARILAHLSECSTDEERVALRRYARGKSTPQDALIAHKFLNSAASASRA